MADELTALAPGAVVTGLPLGKYIGCAGSGKDRFLIKKLHISRSFPGTGDLYGAVLIGVWFEPLLPRLCPASSAE